MRERSVAALAVETATAFAAAAKATAATAAAAAAAATKGTAGAFLLRTGLIDGEGTAAEIGAVDFFCGDLRLFRGAHGDKGKTAGTASHFVHRDEDVGDIAVLAEVRAQVGLAGLEGQVADIEFGITHVMIRRSTVCCQFRSHRGFQIIT